MFGILAQIQGWVKLKGNTDGTKTGNISDAIKVAQSATDFMLSTNNSTTAQLAVGATFTGTIETIFNQQCISLLLTSDQNGTLILNQYIDVAGTRKVAALSYSIIAGVPFNRNIQGNGNFFNLTFKNTGSATTTTLNINVAYGTMPSITALGNGQVSIDEINGIPSSARPDGFLRVAIDPTTLIYDTFETYDTTNVWTAGGTVPPTGGSGSLNFAPGTAANATSFTRTQPAFVQNVNAYLQYLGILSINAATITGNQRFWGIGGFTTPTLSAPVTNGAIFEIDNVTGNLFASVYSSSVRTQTATLVRPTDGGFHRYAIYYRASRVFFEIDAVVVATFSFPNSTVGTQSLVMGSINGASVLGTAATLAVSATGIGDSSRGATEIGDARYPWRTAQVTKLGGLQVEFTEPVTYSACAVALVPVASSATDVFTISGSATKSVRIHKVKVTATTTSGSAIKVNFQAVKRSTANTGGTSAIVSVVPHDSTDPAATAVVRSYTANPSALGTSVGAVRADSSSVSATGVTGGVIEWTWNEVAYKPVILNGVNDFLCVNLGGASITGPIMSIAVEWSEV